MAMATLTVVFAHVFYPLNPRILVTLASQHCLENHVNHYTCNGSTSSLGTLSPPSTSAGTIAAPVACSSAITSNGVLPGSRVAAPQPHSVLSGHQNLYNSTTPLSYYHQSQWSQPAASRPQYPTSQTQTSTLTGSAFSLSYKPPQPPPMSTLLGRYQPAASALPFSYGATATPTQAFSTGAPNLQQVLASLVQQSQYANGTAGAGSGNTSQ
ncbi:hypothetical protein OESDEN_08205 [Oesophagostomum dentatum]|uniref:Uncharacterized protein n=1 Tax=Oesophagostomum dentatum TaxID=61180 RepID=A0A0B1T955_OESDE|nr:hypothetical protein OESDEN_08205 [Oesophagostomum dentatum]